jgi:hypothetical protein
MFRLTLYVGLPLAALLGCIPSEPLVRPSRTAPVAIHRPVGPSSVPQQVIQAAIEALGGEAALRRLQHTFSTGEGQTVILNQVFKFRFKTHNSYPRRTRDDWVFDSGTTFLRILDGERGWISENKVLREMDQVNLKAAQEGLYASHLLTMLPLKDPVYTLEPLPEQRKDGYLCQAFTVKATGRRDVTFFFDKQTHLPHIMKTTVLDANQFTEKEEETYFRDYKDSDGFKYASRWIIYTGGAKSMEITFNELKPLDKVDDAWFTKPK